jgi:hypothetical protein
VLVVVVTNLNLIRHSHLLANICLRRKELKLNSIYIPVAKIENIISYSMSESASRILLSLVNHGLRKSVEKSVTLTRALFRSHDCVRIHLNGYPVEELQLSGMGLALVLGMRFLVVKDAFLCEILHPIRSLRFQIWFSRALCKYGSPRGYVLN